MNLNKSIVFSGSFWTGSTESGLSQGFRTLGWNVQEVDGREIGALGQRNLALRVAARLTRRMSRIVYEKQLIDACTALKPRFFMTVKGVGLTTDFLRRVKETGARTVMYYPDFHFDHPGLSEESFKEYDFFITTKTHQIDYLRRRLPRSTTVSFIPHGYCSSVHRPVHQSISGSEYQVDVQHAGNHSAYKQKWIESAIGALPNASFRLVGDHWQRHAQSTSLERCQMPGPITGVGYADAIQTAKINVSVLMGPTRNGWQDKVSTRTFEIPACRGFMLHIDSEEVRELYTVGREIDVFSSPDELNDKIAFYLDRPDARERMIQSAYERCVPRYSYDLRAKEILAVID